MRLLNCGRGSSTNPSSTVEIDIAVAWLGNELVGERGLFLNPAYELWKENIMGLTMLQVSGVKSQIVFAPPSVN